MSTATQAPERICGVCAEALSTASSWEGVSERPLCMPCGARRAARARWESENPPYGIRVVPRIEFVAEGQPLIVLEVRAHDRLTLRARIIDFSEAGLGLRVSEPLTLGQEVILVAQAALVRRATASWRGRIQWVDVAQPGLWDIGIARAETLHADLFLLLSQIVVSVSP
jgi:hypothetical protein